MMRYASWLTTAIQILSAYKGDIPFAAFIKSYFRQNKKHGSNDRRQISHLCYCYFRTGHAMKQSAIKEKILAGLFLCSHESNELLQVFKPDWNEAINKSAGEKLPAINVRPEDIFPFHDELSDEINNEEFIVSHFLQPDLFIRIRPGCKETVREKLDAAGCTYQLLNDTCIALPNSTKIDAILQLNKEAVVQDYSSQAVASFFPARRGQSIRVWDCCAGSGGKSILLFDLFQTIQLTASDVRESILVNLKKRFTEAGLSGYKSFLTDLTAHSPKLPADSFNFILADVPCSGSGTWGRTPEQMYFFERDEIEKYVALQKKIISNVIPSLQKDGYLLYITCSGFKKENEDVIRYICDNFFLKLVKQQMLKGYDKKADTMFAALMVKPG
ncbi:MAG: Fmu (Sun) domain-containing protein [Chitinophagaceae bacterium]|nr:Fmu (Sun) domain-containing protein [Chitinophagaceae bacterium]